MLRSKHPVSWDLALGSVLQPIQPKVPPYRTSQPSSGQNAWIASLARSTEPLAPANLQPRNVPMLRCPDASSVKGG